MRVLWLCNIIPPVIARELNREVSNKEGWISGMVEAVLADREENGLELSMAFPMEDAPFPVGEKIASIACYGFREDIKNPEKYEESLEQSLQKIVYHVKPDIVHCFGTEYPHTLAMCRIFLQKERLLVGLQGLCSLLAEAYCADLPGKVADSVTFRDWLKKDSIRQQQEKFRIRGRQEREIVSLAGNITGRTGWDRQQTRKWNPDARYFHMNETMRKEFYGHVWQEKECIPHSVFLSQGDYPLKGLHYMLLALPAILERYPDTRVYVAGNSLVAHKTWKDRLKISAYGKYLLKLLKENSLEDKVIFLGKLNAGEMRDRKAICLCVLLPWKIPPIPWGKPCFWECPASVREWEEFQACLRTGKTGLCMKDFPGRTKIYGKTNSLAGGWRRLPGVWPARSCRCGPGRSEWGNIAGMPGDMRRRLMTGVKITAGCWKFIGF